MQLGAKGAADSGFIAPFAYLNHTKIGKARRINKFYWINVISSLLSLLHSQYFLIILCQYNVMSCNNNTCWTCLTRYLWQHKLFLPVFRSEQVLLHISADWPFPRCQFLPHQKDNQSALYTVVILMLLLSYSCSYLSGRIWVALQTLPTDLQTIYRNHFTRYWCTDIGWPQQLFGMTSWYCSTALDRKQRPLYCKESSRGTVAGTKKCGVWKCSLNGTLLRQLQSAYSFPRKNDKIGNIWQCKDYLICGGSLDQASIKL